MLEQRQLLAVTGFAEIGAVTLLSGSPLHIPLDATAAPGDVLTFTAVSNNPNVATYIPEGNRSMRISALSADGAIDGDMVLELFEDRAPRVTDRIIELAESGFYDGIIFHRVINNFMIQTGDPLGTGEGGSDYRDFDDQFHVDLQHNRPGVLSMAKSSDDTNNSQFFITEVATRHLDFNHSIFGLLVEGYDVLGAISDVDTGTGTTPTVDIAMNSVEIFVDNENGVLMLKTPEGYSGTASVTVTVSDGLGGQLQQVIQVTVEADTVDGSPFLADIPEIRTAVDTETTFQLTAIDVEGDTNAVFVDDYTLSQNNLPIPLVSNPDLYYEVDFYTGSVLVSPSNGVTGIHPIAVGTAVYADTIDYQVVPVYVVPDTAPTATLDITLVRDLTEVDTYGEVGALPDDQWIDEWDSFVIEIWATVTEEGEFGVHTVTTDLTFDSSLFTATQIEYGLPFTENRTGQIDNTAGVVADLGGTTGVFVVEAYQNLYPYCPFAPDDVSLYGDQKPVLVARVYFEPNLAGPGVPYNGNLVYPEPVTELGFALAEAQVTWSSVDAAALTTNTLRNAELWPVMYDIDNNGWIGPGDLSYFAAAYGHGAGEPGVVFSYACDFDRNGTVGPGDLSYFASVYGRRPTDEGRLNYPWNFPDAWRVSGEASVPLLFGDGEPDCDDSADAASGDDDASSDLYRDAAVGHALASTQPSQSVARRKLAAVDLLMGLYNRQR